MIITRTPLRISLGGGGTDLSSYYEKYEGFDLYIRIAHDVHKAIPKEQFHRPIFQQFLYKQNVPSDEIIYSLGA